MHDPGPTSSATSSIYVARRYVSSADSKKFVGDGHRAYLSTNSAAQGCSGHRWRPLKAEVQKGSEKVIGVCQSWGNRRHVLQLQQLRLRSRFHRFVREHGSVLGNGQLPSYDFRAESGVQICFWGWSLCEFAAVVQYEDDPSQGGSCRGEDLYRHRKFPYAVSGVSA